MKPLEEILNWYHGLQQRERQLVLAASAVIVITLFYLIVWEPIHKSTEEQTQKYQAQTDVLQWMQNAAKEVSLLKASGGAKKRASSTQPVTLLVEKSVASAGLKPYLSKLESTVDKGARVTFDTVSFDQLLLWLNTLQSSFGVAVTSANIDREDEPGAVNARFTLKRD